MVALVSLIAAVMLTGAAATHADTPRLILGTTVGLHRTGLLDVLVPLFERQTGRSVTTVAVSAPQALALGVRGELDVLLVDAGDDATLYLTAGHGIDRRLVLHADDVLVGPPTDPARAAEAATLTDALRRIAEAQSGWVSRGDNSALNQLERRLWRDAGLTPLGAPWFLALGQGMVPTLAAATERQAYALADRQTFLERRDFLDLSMLVQGAPDLLRLYDVIVVNPAKGIWIDPTGARAFADFLLGAEAQALIGGYGVDRYGQPIFVPDANRTEDDLRPVRRPAA
jgi:tungstate transport system substrate-binding protein